MSPLIRLGRLGMGHFGTMVNLPGSVMSGQAERFRISLHLCTHAAWFPLLKAPSLRFVPLGGANQGRLTKSLPSRTFCQCQSPG